MLYISNNETGLVSIIIVNYNGSKKLFRCLSSVSILSYSPFEIIIVDNGSSDNSIDLINKFSKKHEKIPIHLIRNEKNEGFAKANNIGFEKAKGDYILLLNNDTVITPPFLKKILTTLLENKDNGVVQPKIVFLNSKRLQSGLTYLTNLGIIRYVGYGADPKNQAFNKKSYMFSANGACLLAKRKIIENVGLFDDDFFAYYEESDFCHRVWLAGFKVLYEPSALIYHEGGQTSSKLSQSFIYFHSYKNRVASIIKNFELKFVVSMLPFILVGYIFLIFYFLLTRRFFLCLSILYALVWNLTSISVTMRKRRYIQNKVRKVKDKEYLPFVTYKAGFSYYYSLLSHKEEDHL